MCIVKNYIRADYSIILIETAPPHISDISCSDSVTTCSQSKGNTPPVRDLSQHYLPSSPAKPSAAAVFHQYLETKTERKVTKCTITTNS